MIEIPNPAELRLPIESIIAEFENQPRTDDLDDTYIQQLMEVPDLWPAVRVVRIDGNIYLLVDGFHRHEAASRLGLSDMRAIILDDPLNGDRLSLAFELNAQHGRPLSRADRRGHAEYLLKRDPHQSDRSIAQRCGLSAATVSGVRANLEHGAQITQPSTRVGSDGRHYSVPERKPGELPDKSVGQLVGDGVKGLFDPKEVREMRETARYLQRLKIALADARELPGWRSPAAAAAACVETLGVEKARRLADELAPHLINILEVVDTIAPPP